MDGQQEQIDKISKENGDSKARTKSGLEQIQQVALGMCGPLNKTFEQSTTDSTTKKSQQKERDFRVGEEFKWTMPFETISDDIRAVQQDVVRFGRDLVDDLDVDSNPLTCAPINLDCRQGDPKSQTTDDI